MGCKCCKRSPEPSVDPCESSVDPEDRTSSCFGCCKGENEESSSPPYIASTTDDVNKSDTTTTKKLEFSASGKSTTSNPTVEMEVPVSDTDDPTNPKTAGGSTCSVENSSVSSDAPLLNPGKSDVSDYGTTSVVTNTDGQPLPVESDKSSVLPNIPEGLHHEQHQFERQPPTSQGKVQPPHKEQTPYNETFHGNPPQNYGQPPSQGQSSQGKVQPPHKEQSPYNDETSHGYPPQNYGQPPSQGQSSQGELQPAPKKQPPYHDEASHEHPPQYCGQPPSQGQSSSQGHPYHEQPPHGKFVDPYHLNTPQNLEKPHSEPIDNSSYEYQDRGYQSQPTTATVSKPSTPPYYSFYSIENARYSINNTDYSGVFLNSRSDHPNDDRVFVINEEGQASILAVFDGHDGSNASSFACDHMQSLFLSPDVLMQLNQSYVDQILMTVFVETETDFFKQVQHLILEKEDLQRLIPQNMTSYQAQQFYPHLISRIQEIEPELSGGTTAVVAIIVNGLLYVANAGDSRAVLVRKTTNGTTVIEQISVDHTVHNPNELERLSQLGLNKEELIKSGRLGTQENTRCIGDYTIKKGYKDIDVLSNASGPPGDAMPDVKGPIQIDSSCQYLLLMTDGVYKSLESLNYPPSNDQDTMYHLLNIIQSAEVTCQNNLGNIAADVLEHIKYNHEQTYFNNARIDMRSPLAVECRKRDDMTLIILCFGNN